MFFEIAQVHLPLADCRVYKDNLQNESVIKPFRAGNNQKAENLPA